MQLYDCNILILGRKDHLSLQCPSFHTSLEAIPDVSLLQVVLGDLCVLPAGVSWFQRGFTDCNNTEACVKQLRLVPYVLSGFVWCRV